MILNVYLQCLECVRVLFALLLSRSATVSCALLSQLHAPHPSREEMLSQSRNSKLKHSPDKRRHRERGMAIIMMALLLALFFVNYPGIPHEV